MSEETPEVLPEGALEAAQAFTEETIVETVEAAPVVVETPTTEPNWDEMYAKAESIEERADIFDQKQAFLEGITPETPVSEEATQVLETADVTTDIKEAVEEIAKIASEEPIPTTFKVKVDGTESDVSVEELTRVYQMEQSATKRFQEASEMRKSVEDFNMYLEKDPLGALKAKGIDVDELAQNYIAEKAEYALMTDEQRKINDLEKKISSIAGEKDIAEQKAEQDAFNAEVKELQAHYEKAIPEALEGGGLVVNDFTISRVRHYMLQFDSQGFKDVEPEHVIKLVNDELSSIAKSITKSTPKKVTNTVTKPVKVGAKVEKKLPEVGSEDFDNKATAAFNKYFG